MPRPTSVPAGDNFDPVLVPHDNSPEVEVKSAEDVRQGERGHHVWQILTLSFAGAALAMGIAYLIFFQ